MDDFLYEMEWILLYYRLIFVLYFVPTPKLSTSSSSSSLQKTKR